MLQITTDVISLTMTQREALSEFLLTFPGITEEPLTVIPDFTVIDEEQTPEQAFGPTLVPAPPTSNLDKAGLPWDERIHASSHSLTADGYWRKKRGVEDALVSQVEGELKAVMGLPAPAAQVPPPPPATVEVTALPVTAEVPAPPATSAVPAPPAQSDRDAFIKLVTESSAAIVAGRLTQEELAAAVASVNVPSLPLLSNRPDLVPQVATFIDALLSGRP